MNSHTAWVPRDALSDISEKDPAIIEKYLINKLEFQKERMADNLDDIKFLHKQHWLETEKYRHGLPFNPDYARFLEWERINYFHLFTARSGGKLVGNCGVYVQKSMHTQEPIAVEDTLYLLPDYRKGRNAIQFIKWVENYLTQKMGVVEIDIDVKLSNKVGKLMNYIGYEPTSMKYSKIFRGK